MSRGQEEGGGANTHKGQRSLWKPMEAYGSQWKPMEYGIRLWLCNLRMYLSKSTPKITLPSIRSVGAAAPYHVPATLGYRNLIRYICYTL